MEIEKIEYEKDWGNNNIGMKMVDYLVVHNDEVIDHFETRKKAEQFIKENKCKNQY